MINFFLRFWDHSSLANLEGCILQLRLRPLPVVTLTVELGKLQRLAFSRSAGVKIDGQLVDFILGEHGKLQIVGSVEEIQNWQKIFNSASARLAVLQDMGLALGELFGAGLAFSSKAVKLDNWQTLEKQTKQCQLILNRCRHLLSKP